VFNQEECLQSVKGGNRAANHAVRFATNRIVLAQTKLQNQIRWTCGETTFIDAQIGTIETSQKQLSIFHPKNREIIMRCS
jgi:hypothetical protein